VFMSAPPARGRFPVPQEFPALRLFLFGQVIGQGVYHKYIVGWGRLQIFGFDPDIPPANLFTCVFFISDGMNLQADQAAWGEVVLQMGCRHAVQPGPDGAADALDAGLVPLSLFEGLLGFGIQGEWIKPSSSRFIIDSRAPGPVGWVQFKLI